LGGFAHPAIGVDPKHRQLNAAIRLTPPAGYAGPTIEVGLHRTTLAGSNRISLSAQLQYLDAELMSKNARISENRPIALERMDVSATNANTVHSDQGLIRLKGRRCGLKVHLGETAGLFQTDCFHSLAEPIDSSAGPTNKSRCSNRPRVKLKLDVGLSWASTRVGNSNHHVGPKPWRENFL
jgi:hypothetical protein